MAAEEVTLRLLVRARSGDRDALDSLFARYLPRMQRWARQRLPVYARDVTDTQDIVQDVLLSTFTRVEGFDARREGALQAYLRQALLNRVRDEIRRAARRPNVETFNEGDRLSALEQAVGREALEWYEEALARLPEDDREAIIGRLEMGFTHEELAEALGRPSAEAARKFVERALVRLAQEMRRVR